VGGGCLLYHNAASPAEVAHEVGMRRRLRLPNPHAACEPIGRSSQPKRPVALHVPTLRAQMHVDDGERTYACCRKPR
jgi:hypothetical protein